MGIFTAIKDIFAPHTSYAKRRTNPPATMAQVKTPPPTFPRAETKSNEDNIVKVRFADALKRCRESGYDLVRISNSCDECNAECEGLHGRIISVFGRTPGFPKLSDIDAHLLFGGELGHDLEYVDEVADGDEIELQRANPVTDFTPHGLERNLYKIEIDRYCRKGMMRQDAIAAVARDRLDRAIRCGLAVDAVGIVNEMTDPQVLALCPSGHPPTFDPFKATKKEIAKGASESFHNGIVCIMRDGLSAARILSLCRV